MKRIDRELLATWKRIFKQHKNKDMWHQLVEIEKKWDTLDKVQQDHVFETLDHFFGKINFS